MYQMRHCNKPIEVVLICQEELPGLWDMPYLEQGQSAVLALIPAIHGVGTNLGMIVIVKIRHSNELDRFTFPENLRPVSDRRRANRVW